MEFRLLGAVAIAAVCTRLVVGIEARRDGKDRPVAAAWEDMIVAGIAGLAIGRVVAMIAGGVNPITHPLDLLIVRGGVETVAATIGALLTLAVVGRADLLAIADTAAPAAIAGLAGWHAGCVVRDACLGTTSGLPWAVEGASGVGRHPVEIYAALILGVGAVGLLLAWLRGPRPGMVAALALAVAGFARLITEPMRLGIGSGPAWWYAGAVGAGVAAAVVAAASGRHRA